MTFSHNPKGAYQHQYAKCPYCGFNECEYDLVDVGVGVVQCGPTYCDQCGASEIGGFDKPRDLTEEEKKYGWYKPGSPVSDKANTIGGMLVDHKTASSLYKLGLLDE